LESPRRDRGHLGVRLQDYRSDVNGSAFWVIILVRTRTWTATATTIAHSNAIADADARQGRDERLERGFVGRGDVARFTRLERPGRA
jgi:hypothetical protein